MRIIGHEQPSGYILIEECDNLLEFKDKYDYVYQRTNNGDFTDLYWDKFTYVYDSNNKKIYENDIISIKDYPENGDGKEILFLVQYDKNVAMFTLTPFPKGNTEGDLIGIEERAHDFFLLEDSEYHVIGNIYMNCKELLGIEFKDYYE